MRIVDPIARQGEDAAATYLRKLGYKIIEKNFRKGYGEIDIIALRASGQAGFLGKDETLVFIEVKTRTSLEFGSPFEAITPWKVRTLVKTAQFYKLLHPNLPDLLRIDAIAVRMLKNGEVESIEHEENISGF